LQLFFQNLKILRVPDLGDIIASSRRSPTCCPPEPSPCAILAAAVAPPPAARTKRTLGRFSGLLAGQTDKVATIDEINDAAAAGWAGEV